MQISAHLRFAGFVLCLTVAGAPDAWSLSKEEAIENCRATVGRPIVQSCMRGGSGNIEACRQLATPQVRSCVISALNAANGRANIPVAAPKETKSPDAESLANALPAGLVAPPRTVSDITAILDSEKPDPQKISQRKAAADATPAGGASRQDLARFYYDRGNARAQLGRLNESILDANKAVEIGKGAVDLNLFGRLLQFLGLQYAAAGDPKKGLTVFQRQIKETNAPGAKGYLFGGHRQISMFLIQMGDVAQADTYLGRNTALIQEARTSGLPGWRSSYAIRGQAWNRIRISSRHDFRGAGPIPRC